MHTSFLAYAIKFNIYFGSDPHAARRYKTLRKISCIAAQIPHSGRVMLRIEKTPVTWELTAFIP